MTEPTDFLTMDFFNPPTPQHVEFKPKGREIPHPVPGEGQLFSIQKNLVDAINFFEEIEDSMPKTHASARMVANLYSAYRQLNRYLRDYTGRGPQTF